VDHAILINRLKSKPDLNQIVSEAIENPSMLISFIEIVQTESSSVKFACTKVMRLISEQRPELVYPYFDEIVKWLYNKNSFIKWDGILIISNLVAVDSENRFEEVYENYFALVHDSQMITAANVVGNAWKIVIAKPELENDITRRLLEVPQVVYVNKGKPSPECNCIVCGQVLECFEHFFENSKNQALMIKFAEDQLGNQRKTVAKKAEKFLRRHGVTIKMV